jgi:hypothetical protein
MRTIAASPATPVILPRRRQAPAAEVGAVIVMHDPFCALAIASGRVAICRKWFLWILDAAADTATNAV